LKGGLPSLVEGLSVLSISSRNV